MPIVTFLPDQKQVEVGDGETLLDASLRSGMPHACACGGTARCTTCRVWVLNGEENCAPRTADEQKWAESLKFDSRIRLACQTTINGDVTLRRLVLNDVDLEVANRMNREDVAMEGHERNVAIMFSDIRGFTSFSENLPPYDVLFVLNRYFLQLGQVIEQHGGQINNYMGDGMIALFGVDGDENPVLEAVRAGMSILGSMTELMQYLMANYDRILDIGIGIHYGPVIMGSMGYGESRRVSTIDDAVNFASRIESANKAAGTRLLISDEAYRVVRDEVEVGGQFELDLKGKSGQPRLYEISGLRQETAETARNLEVQESGGVRWQKVASLADLEPEGKCVVEVEGSQVLLAQTAEGVFAIERQCPHLRLPMESGELNEDNCLVCPWHRSSFELSTGEVKHWAVWPPGPAEMLSTLGTRRSLRTWATRVDDGALWVSLDDAVVPTLAE